MSTPNSRPRKVAPTVVRFPEELRTRLEDRAGDEGRTLSALVRDAVEALLASPPQTTSSLSSSAAVTRLAVSA